MYCINCGNQVNSTDNFCDKCGANLSTNQNNKSKMNKSKNISLTLGIIACSLFFIPFISIPLAILAIIFGIINRKEHKLIGLVLGFISIILVTIEIIALVLFTGFITKEITEGDFLEEIIENFDEHIETELEINGNSFITSDNSIIEFKLEGNYDWTIDELNYNKGSYMTYTKTKAYYYAKNKLPGFNQYKYDIEDFYLIIMKPTEIMMDGNIIEETNTVYYYGEYEIEEQTLELYNHNTGNILELTLYNNSKPNKIDI